LSSYENVKNFEDVLNTPEAAIQVTKKKQRDVQFYFLINPKAGKGTGQKILEKNPRGFKFTTKFWETLPFCNNIRDLSVNFISTERKDKVKIMYEQVSNISNVSLGKNVNQYIVVCGGDGTLAQVLQDISEFNPNF
jgi:diacylglycerol kinase family enzyme